ncbi:TIGR03089 family protein [Georgenia sp. AZ-5]|uniref:TIGR03089 family protein n=1 Tax=Georgenia sp. AZ-5 TaxID=3367526 RepID=UPI0037545C8F
MSLPQTLPGDLLASFAGTEATSPRLTWYGADGERTELSGRVLANWVTKAANLLIEEADAEPGTKVVLDLPVHWRSLVWALATWTAGAQLVLPGTEDSDGEAQVVVTHRPGEAPGEDAADLVLAVALPALAMRWDGDDLPGGVVDAAAEVMTYGDALSYVSEPEDDDLALTSDDLEATYGELTSWATGSAELGDGAAADDADDEAAPVRVLVSPGTIEQLLEQALAVWRSGGSLVLAEPGTPAERLDRIAQEERVEVRW